MADAKISQLSAATALAGTEVVPVVQGGSTKKATIDQILSPAAGKGIDFSANGGNVLTQYDEGEWTPGYAFSTPGTSLFTYTGGRLGTYVRIGKLVTCFFYLDNVTIAKGTASGNLKVTGLPFTVSGNTDYSGGVVTMTDSYPVNPQSFLTLTGTTTAAMRKTGGGASVTAADFGAANTVFLRGCISYLV